MWSHEEHRGQSKRHDGESLLILDRKSKVIGAKCEQIGDESTINIERRGHHGSGILRRVPTMGS